LDHRHTAVAAVAWLEQGQAQLKTALDGLNDADLAVVCFFQGIIIEELFPEAGKMTNSNLQAGLLAHFAVERFFHALAYVHAASRQGVFTGTSRVKQQDSV
jgi:hypothetical protein